MVNFWKKAPQGCALARYVFSQQACRARREGFASGFIDDNDRCFSFLQCKTRDFFLDDSEVIRFAKNRLGN
jgi:hypothetical protein